MPHLKQPLWGPHVPVGFESGDSLVHEFLLTPKNISRCSFYHLRSVTLRLFERIHPHKYSTEQREILISRCFHEMSPYVAKISRKKSCLFHTDQTRGGFAPLACEHIHIDATHLLNLSISVAFRWQLPHDICHAQIRINFTSHRSQTWLHLQYTCG